MPIRAMVEKDGSESELRAKSAGYEGIGKPLDTATLYGR